MWSEDGTDWLILVLASPSGAGKTSLKNRLLADFPRLRFSVSHTTRRQRPHELDGRDYHFVDRRTFEMMIDQGEFAEHAEVFGNLYGTSLAELRRASPEQTGVVLDLDVQGARQMAARIPRALSVFILPPSFEELERRLRARADEPESSIRRRLAEARDEVKHYAMFDHLIVNDELDRAYEQLRAVVLAEGSRRWRQAHRAEALLRGAKKS
ncbi:MAG: guanylate kinase [Myxococcales bacterium]|nr:guanylate kinase [Polyangiaceae bacterium]MDW8249978.1 guanylate kinase [Myxococcales bacterium]